MALVDMPMQHHQSKPNIAHKASKLRTEVIAKLPAVM
jgi:hypothetical protein